MLNSKKKALVFDEAKFIYVEMPKAACSSIKQALGEAMKVPQEQILEWRRGRVPWVDISEERYKDYFKFSFVRNPWDRLVSCYENKFNQDNVDIHSDKYIAPLKERLGVDQITFESFLGYIDLKEDLKSDIHWRSQYYFLLDQDGVPLVPNLGRFENLANDFKEICKIINIDAELPKLQVSKNRNKDYSSYYSAETRQFVEQRYNIDINLLGYSF